MKRKTIIVVCLALAFAAAALGEQPLEQKIEKLKAEATQAHDGHQADLHMEVARREVELASKRYEGGQAEQGRALMEEATSYAEKATAWAVESGKKLKQTEIKLRKLGEEMQAVKRSTEFENREPLDKMLQRIEHARTELLNRMFKK